MLPPDIIITGYAWMRFITRQEIYAQPLVCPMKELRRLLAIAKPENLRGGAVQRLLNNGLQPAAYFEAENWRIVTNEDLTKVITIEWALIGRKKNTKYRKPWWR
jgi:hypothetical protein